MIPMLPGLLTPASEQALPAVLADVYVLGSGFTLAGRAAATFPSPIPAIEAEEFNMDLTVIGICGPGETASLLGLAYGYYLGCETVPGEGYYLTDANTGTICTATSQAAGGWFGASSLGDFASDFGGSLVTAPLGLPALTMAFTDNGGVFLMWKRALSAAEMIEAMSYYA